MKRIPGLGPALALLLVVGAGCSAPRGALPETTPDASRLVLLSVPGLTHAALERDMPTLARMADAGVLAERLRGVAPASERPAHATLVTGVPPARHGIVSDHRLGERGVRRAGYDHASLLRSDTLWQRAIEGGLPVAALDWPTTLGSAIPQLVPDLGTRLRGPWADALAKELSPEMLARVREHGGDAEDSGPPGPAHDAVIGGMACDLLASESPPRLVLLRFGRTRAALARQGPDAEATGEAFAGVDRAIWELLVCLEWAGRLTDTAVAVTGDHGVVALHTEIAPNALLERADLIELDARGIGHWRALARSNGGSAFVYARDEAAAVRARAVLGAAAEETGAFRVVSADEMIRAGADPEAWFGLEAALGFGFADRAEGPSLATAQQRGTGGYLPERPEMAPAFVAWGAGVRRGLRVPEMRQIDVAPTLARLLGLRLPDAEGRELVGLLTPEAQRGAAAGPR